ncbi:hypothetical protein HY213_01115 [Candidatus Peregrinibacteria bacterium]|nr:hypothetical protein [Candidatus Peregrinibacteria bacterium]
MRCAVSVLRETAFGATGEEFEEGMSAAAATAAKQQSIVPARKRDRDRRIQKEGKGRNCEAVYQSATALDHKQLAAFPHSWLYSGIIRHPSLRL